MSLKSELQKKVAEDARLAILKELAAQTDGRLNLMLLQHTLDTYGFRRSRDWVLTQLRALEDLSAIDLMEAGGMWIARIERAGRDHLDERSILSGVTRPAEAE